MRSEAPELQPSRALSRRGLHQRPKSGHFRRTGSRFQEDDKRPMEKPRSKSTSEAATTVPSAALFGTPHTADEKRAGASPKDEPVQGAGGRVNSAHTEEECPSFWEMEPVLTSVFGQVTGVKGKWFRTKNKVTEKIAKKKVLVERWGNCTV